MESAIFHGLCIRCCGTASVRLRKMCIRDRAKQLAEKTAGRQYYALVHGVINHEYGTIDAPIGRDEKDRQKMAVTEKNSRPAITHFKVVERFDNYTLVSCRLETGRTHQIRVHMQYSGCLLYTSRCV